MSSSEGVLCERLAKHGLIELQVAHKLALYYRSDAEKRNVESHEIMRPALVAPHALLRAAAPSPDTMLHALAAATSAPLLVCCTMLHCTLST